MKVRVDLSTPIYDGMEVKFKAPCDAAQVTGLNLYYIKDGVQESQNFAFADANANNVGHIDALFAAGAVVKVILDLETNMAFIQNADTNSYLENMFKKMGGGVGAATPEGGSVFNDIETNKATAEFATAFGSESKAEAKGAIAAGMRIPKSGANITYDDEGRQVAVNEEDWRYNEAYGYGSEAFGKGAVAYSRASKSFGYRTQTGYPPSAEHAKARPEAIVKMDANGNPEYPADNVGQGAVALGADTAALGNHDFAGGWASVARGQSSFAFGDHNEASGYCAVSLGHETKATGYAAVAVGDQCEATKENCFAGGSLSKSTAGNSIAFGYGCTASTRRTVALGSEANASGEMGATAIGHQVTANGKGAIAMGSGSTAKGEGTFAVGAGSQATSYGAFAYGDHCIASNYNAIAGGANSKAKQSNTGAIGRRLVTGRSSQFVVGQDNAEDASALFVVGNGTSDTNRMNAFVVNADGSAKVAGRLSFGSIDDTSRNKILAHKTSYNTPTINNRGDYVGQIWLVLSQEDGTTSDVYMYVGVNLGGYYWQKL